jgi:hypothetical protein
MRFVIIRREREKEPWDIANSYVYFEFERAFNYIQRERGRLLTGHYEYDVASIEDGDL